MPVHPPGDGDGVGVISAGGSAVSARWRGQETLLPALEHFEPEGISLSAGFSARPSVSCPIGDVVDAGFRREIKKLSCCDAGVFPGAKGLQKSSIIS